MPDVHGRKPSVFAAGLKAWRIKQGYSQAGVGRMLGMDKRIVQKYETGKRYPSRMLQEMIYKLLHDGI